MNKLGLADLSDDDLEGKRVLVRVDFNVPIEPGGAVEADTRVRRSIPTLERLTGAGARVILLSHLGRPGGAPDPAYTLEPVVEVVRRSIDAPVSFVAEVVGEEVAARVRSLPAGEMLLLENTRFHPGEKANDRELAERWADLGDLYVNDAFGSAHRAHASTSALPAAIRRRGGLAVSGFLMDEEVRYLHDALREPDRPFVAILGGAKISGKIDVVEALIPRVDRLLVGGAMANTFLKALGLDVGSSLVEDDRLEMARDVLEMAGETLVLPVDCVVAEKIEEGARVRVADRTDVGAGEAIGDIGPETRALYREPILEAGTIVWNGPMGVFELDAFAEGTRAVAGYVSEASEGGALTVVGGGDSAAAVQEAGLEDRIGHISTGGGASLDMLAGKSLPGIEALSEGRNGA